MSTVKLALRGVEVPFSEISLDGTTISGSDLVRENGRCTGYIRVGRNGNENGDGQGPLRDAAISLFVKIKLNADLETWDRLEAIRRNGGMFRVSIEEV